MSKKEGFFGNLFKSKKDETMDQVEMLNSIIDERNQIIGQLKEELIDEKKRTGIDLKQLEIYEKNLKNKDKKNSELSNQILILEKSKIEVEEKLKTLKNGHEKFAIEMDFLKKENEKIKNDYLELSNTFKLIEGESQALNISKEDLRDDSKEKMEHLNALKDKGEQMQLVGDLFISKDEMEELEIKIQSLNKLCGDQRERINALEFELSHKDSIVEDFKERLRQALSPKSEEVKYRLPVEELFSSSRFSEIKNALTEMGILLVKELKEKNLTTLLGEGVKNIDTGSKLLEDYFLGKTNWEIKTYLYKGDKLSKIFNRQRKLLNYFSDNYMEFASDLDNFDFEVLLEEGFSSKQVEKFKDILEQYNLEKKI